MMHGVAHHVADEEAGLLPAAERELIKGEPRSLGAAMTHRRLQPLRERPMEIASNTAGTFPVAAALLATTVALAIRYCLPGPRRVSQRER